MDFGSVPLALFLLLPGFLVLHVMFLISRVRRVSAFYATMWSLAASLILIATSYPIFTLVVNPPLDISHWPGLLDILGNPEKVPGPIWGLLYGLAPLLGIVLGVLDRKRHLEKLFRLLRIDLEANSDLWYKLLREDGYGGLLVYLKDGSLVSGWPKYFSNDREPPGPEIYLSDFRVWDPESGSWKVQEGILGSLIHGNEISRVEFIPKDVTEDSEGMP
ncbi:MAG: DUF6338 family protein [Chloroflexota bacterium]